jgi:hypothetical protein
MSNYVFNYDKFYNFYTNQKNLITNKDDSVVLHFFNKTTKKGVKIPKICEPKQTDERCQYIIINGYKIYIADYSKTGRAENQKEDSKELLFSIPTEINGKLYDFHYHFIKKIKYSFIKQNSVFRVLKIQSTNHMMEKDFTSTQIVISLIIFL